jgi:hypothetical protein
MSTRTMHPRLTFSLSGTAKAGTTTAYALLTQHPDICMSSVKETDYFQHNHERGLQWFESLFAHYAGEAAIGEASPGNIVEPEAPARMFAINPDMMVIFILRDPVARIVSQYNYGLHRGTDAAGRDFSRWIRDTSDPWRNRNIELGSYHRHLTRFVDVFGAERLIVVPFEELVRQTDATMRRIFAGLGVKEDVALSLSVKSNESAMPVHDGAYRMIRNSFRRIRDGLGRESSAIRLLEPMRRGVRGLLMRSGTNAVELIGHDDIEYLRALYHEQNTLLSRDFGIDVTLWKASPSASSDAAVERIGEA